MFVAIAELGSLTRAAEHLHRSQPAASAQIKLLEDEFGIALFERKLRGLTLTAAGASLLPEIKDLLASANHVSTHAKSLSGRVTGPIKFATVATVFDKSILRVGEMIKLILTRYHLLDIEVHHCNSRSIVAGIANGEFDAGIALGNRNIPNIRRILLKEIQYRIVAPAIWGERMRKASWKELASSPWILAPKGGSHHQMAMHLFKRSRFQPDKVIEADSELVIASLVTAGVGLGLMPEDLALDAQVAGNVLVVENGRPSTYLQALHHASREGDPAIHGILGVLRELWPDEGRLASNHTVKSA